MGYPQVPKAAVDGFAKVWNKGGISIILDETVKKFALDFANVALRSYVDMQVAAAKAMQAAQQGAGPKCDTQPVVPTNAVSTAAVPPPPATTKGLIQLTDV